MPSFRAAWIMAGRSGVGSGAAAASGSAKTASATITVDTLSMSRLESLLARMFGPAAFGWDETAHLTAFTTLGIRRKPRGTLNVEKDITPVTTLQGYRASISDGAILSSGTSLMAQGAVEPPWNHLRCFRCCENDDE